MVQTRAPEAVRGRAFARFETRFQVAWVAGAIVATATGVAIQISLAVVAVGLIPAAGLYVRTIREARRAAVDEHVDYVELMVRRLDRAREWQRRNQSRLAVIELAALVDVARATDHLVDPRFTTRLERMRATVVAGGRPDDAQLEWAVRRASDFLTGLEPEPQAPSSGSTDVDVTTHCDERGANVKTKWEESSAER
jgi:hypothetical protein